MSVVNSCQLHILNLNSPGRCQFCRTVTSLITYVWSRTTDTQGACVLPEVQHVSSRPSTSRDGGPEKAGVTLAAAGRLDARFSAKNNQYLLLFGCVISVGDYTRNNDRVADNTIWHHQGLELTVLIKTSCPPPPGLRPAVLLRVPLAAYGPSITGIRPSRFLVPPPPGIFFSLRPWPMTNKQHLD